MKAKGYSRDLFKKEKKVKKNKKKDQVVQLEEVPLQA